MKSFNKHYYINSNMHACALINFFLVILGGCIFDVGRILLFFRK